MSHAVSWMFAIGWMLLGAWCSIFVARDQWRRGHRHNAAITAAAGFWIVLSFWWFEVLR